MTEEIDAGCRCLNGKVCVIAGAASVIGHAVAERLIREGAAVVGIDREGHNVGSIAIVANSY